MNFSRRAFLHTSGRLAAASLGLSIHPAAAADRPAARVVVVGGGYGGCTVARYLRIIAPRVHVTLVDRDTHHESCPGSNEVLGGISTPGSLRRSRWRLAALDGVNLVRGEVRQIDRSRREVVLRTGSRIAYDRLILSPGIALRWDAIAGYDPAASLKVPHAWQGGEQIALLRRQLQTMRPGGTAIILAPANPYRCPPGPYERASLFAYHLKRRNPRAKILIIDAKTQFSKQALFLQGWRDLYPGMIDWLPHSAEGAVERVDADRRVVNTEFGVHRADVLNVIPPQRAADLASACDLADETGWCPVDPVSFESTRHPGIHVIGDACIASPMPKSAFAANSQAKVCAAAVAALLDGRTPEKPSLINHCFSFLNPDYAISVSGVYAYSAAAGALVANATGETPPDGDRAAEARYARAWQRQFARDVFG